VPRLGVKSDLARASKLATVGVSGSFRCDTCNLDVPFHSGMWTNGLSFELRECTRCRDVVTVLKETWSGIGPGGREVMPPAELPMPVGVCPICRSDDQLVDWPGSARDGGRCPRCNGRLTTEQFIHVD
jgi:RNA polymerase subunit RPABC4/transcription elongation factor Spt4